MAVEIEKEDVSLELEIFKLRRYLFLLTKDYNNTSF